MIKAFGPVGAAIVCVLLVGWALLEVAACTSKGSVTEPAKVAPESACRDEAYAIGGWGYTHATCPVGTDSHLENNVLTCTCPRSDGGK